MGDAFHFLLQSPYIQHETSVYLALILFTQYTFKVEQHFSTENVKDIGNFCIYLNNFFKLRSG